MPPLPAYFDGRTAKCEGREAPSVAELCGLMREASFPHGQWLLFRSGESRPVIGRAKIGDGIFEAAE